MFRALVLVRNFHSNAEELDFGEFKIDSVGHRFKELRELFSSVDVYQDDWTLEKHYQRLPQGPPGSAVGGIPGDIEDTLLLLRLYKSGDLSFVKQVIIPPSGKSSVQHPYGAINDLNSYATPIFEVGTEDCPRWGAFADTIRKSPAWRSDWFASARRFFLSGGAKPFNPMWDEVDRIVDYATALEAVLVPEKDYSTRRMSRRASELISRVDLPEKTSIVSLIKQFYDIRSRIVHGSKLTEENRKWLLDNRAQLELRVRQVLVTAVQQLPAAEQNRCAALAAIYDPSDEDRGNSALERFREIKTVAVRQETAARIAELSSKKNT